VIETFADEAALTEAAAAAVLRSLAQGLTSRPRATLVATGGRSPGAIYDRLARSDLDWSRIDVTLSDERCVAADHADSNARLVRERLLAGPAAGARFHPLWPAPEAADLMPLRPFDAVLLGMGEDGHIASLIPGDPGLPDALNTPEVLRQVPPGLGKPPLARITLTLSALIDARAIFLCISGEAKRAVLARALAGEDLPVGRLISQSSGRTRIFWRPE
jgi:6-phosphogluconolactonase